MMTDAHTLRTQMVDICRRMNASGVNQGTSGNLSVRFGDGFLITPSGRPYETMDPADLVQMAFDGTYDGLRPSSEWRFHRDILKARPDIDVCCIATQSMPPPWPATTNPSRRSTI